MTWDELLALDVDGLNRALFQTQYRLTPAELEAYPRYAIPRVTDRWHATMALTCRSHVDLAYGYNSGNTLGWAVSHWQGAHSLWVAEADGPQALRVALCRMALWVARQETQPCGHPRSAIVSSDEGTATCGGCVEEQQEGETHADHR